MATSTNSSLETSRARILYLSADPRRDDDSERGYEIRRIEAMIQMSRYRNRIELFKHSAVHVADLQRAILSTEPHILHFSVDGTVEREIVLHQEGDHEARVASGAIAHLIGVLKATIRVVVLNTSHSEALARTLVEHVDCAIGMRRASRGREAIEFAGAFYQAIGYGRSVKNAFELGLNALDLNKLQGDYWPELVQRPGTSADDIVLVRPAAHAGAVESTAGRPGTADSSHRQGTADGLPPDPDASSRASITTPTHHPAGYVPRQARLEAVLPGEWRISISSAAGVLLANAVLTLDTAGTFQGHLMTAAREAPFAGAWRALNDGTLELRGAISLGRREAPYTSAIRFLSISHNILRGESALGELIVWQKTGAPERYR